MCTTISKDVVLLLTILQKRHRREYRRQQRQRFTRPEPGFSLYEGRTRGKRMRYTYDDDNGSESDATSTRRSARQSTRNTPFEAGPTTTSSGRQVRQPRTGEYGESILSGPPLSTDELAPGYSDPEQIMSRGRSGRSTRSGTEDSEQPVGRGRPTRSGLNGVSNPRKRAYNDIDGLSDEEDAEPSGDEWDSDQNDGADDQMPDAEADDDLSEDVEESDVGGRSLVVRIKVSPERLIQVTSARSSPAEQNGSTPPPAADDMTRAGAPKIEAATLDQKPVISTNGTLDTKLTQQHHVASPPASSYPTPNSSSFLPTERKASLASAGSAPHIVARSTMEAPQYGNGLHPTNGTHVPVNAALNGVQGGAYSSANGT